MKSVGIVMMIVCGMVMLGACTPKASPEQCQSACQKQIDLSRAENPAAPDPVTETEKTFGARIAELQQAMATEMKALDDELATAAGAAANDAAREKLNEEFSAKKQAKAQEYAPRFDALNQEKETAMTAARQAHAAAEEARLAAEAEAVKGCVETCTKETPVKKAECQINAATLADFNNCQ